MVPILMLAAGVGLQAMAFVLALVLGRLISEKVPDQPYSDAQRRDGQTAVWMFCIAWLLSIALLVAATGMWVKG